ncbi:MAG: translation initiation factor IF-2 [Phycisphaera sp.]|nr:translation initiation factor IF-2 [Phycisphaera sp.]
MILAKARRIFQIARDLGVESKAILDKCRAEGLDINNHMSAVSAGLEATITEWFSEHEDTGGTAIETAAKVDLTQVKAKARKRKKLGEVSTDEDDDGVEESGDHAEVLEAEDDAVAEASEEEIAEEAAKKAAMAQGKAKAKPKSSEEEGEEAEQASATDEVTASATEADAATSPPAVAAEAPAVEERPKVVPNEPERPEVVTPAGPRMEKPQEVKLRGPNVVRIEAPEQVRAPRPRRPAPQEAQPDIIRSRGPARGKGAGAGAGKGAEDDAARSPRRKKSRKRGEPADNDSFWKGARREQDLIEREARLSHASGFLKQRRRDLKKRAAGGGPAETPAQVGGEVAIAEPITIKNLSSVTGIKGSDVVKFLFKKGIMATINATIGAEAAQEICMEYDIDLKVKEAETAEDRIIKEIDDRERTDVQRRPPIVAVLGHVDHGKTSLLDKIRNADVASGEAGGITQHIGAFRTTIKGTDGADKSVVFLDTPGHQAFTHMRSRGANLADIVVLVVAADDGVMPQTIESINHAKAAGVRIVVALNKMDRPDATDKNIQKILAQLADHELNPTEWGGETEVVKVSAMTGAGIPELIEVLDYQAELQELTADYGGSAYGQVIEAELDPGRGAVARVLVQEGHCKVGDFVVIGRAFGKVRSIMDDRGNQIVDAGPATPVEISGIDEVPDAGDKMYVTPTLKRAEEIATQRRHRERSTELAEKTKVTLDNVFAQMQAAQVKELRIVIKADVQGSVEVLKAALEKLVHDEVKVKVLHAAVGGITESDVLLAEASEAIIIGFNVIASQKARAEAEQRDVDIRLYRVIYDIIEDVTGALEGMLAPTKREDVLGHAEVREVFKVSKVGAVAGCYVTDGVVQRNALIRVTRDDIVIEHDRKLEQLKRFKDDAKEVKSGMECGMKIEGYDDIRQGDILECYVTTEVKSTFA